MAFPSGRNRVVPAAVPWVTAADPTDRHPASPHGTVLKQRIDGVGATTGLVTAGGRQGWRDEPPVEVDRSEQRPGRERSRHAGSPFSGVGEAGALPAPVPNFRTAARNPDSRSPPSSVLEAEAARASSKRSLSRSSGGEDKTMRDTGQGLRQRAGVPERRKHPATTGRQKAPKAQKTSTDFAVLNRAAHSPAKGRK